MGSFVMLIAFGPWYSRIEMNPRPTVMALISDDQVKKLPPQVLKRPISVMLRPTITIATINDRYNGIVLLQTIDIF
jgi:hypothetical protein